MHKEDKTMAFIPLLRSAQDSKGHPLMMFLPTYMLSHSGFGVSNHLTMSIHFRVAAVSLAGKDWGCSMVYP